MKSIKPKIFGEVGMDWKCKANFSDVSYFLFRKAIMLRSIRA